MKSFGFWVGHSDYFIGKCMSAYVRPFVLDLGGQESQPSRFEHTEIYLTHEMYSYAKPIFRLK